MEVTINIPHDWYKRLYKEGRTLQLERWYNMSGQATWTYWNPICKCLVNGDKSNETDLELTNSVIQLRKKKTIEFPGIGARSHRLKYGILEFAHKEKEKRQRLIKKMANKVR